MKMADIKSLTWPVQSDIVPVEIYRRVGCQTPINICWEFLPWLLLCPCLPSKQLIHPRYL
jgi:hypothetical protein